jgi:hypothetical protein
MNFLGLTRLGRLLLTEVVLSIGHTVTSCLSAVITATNGPTRNYSSYISDGTLANI